ncbi:PBP1A family penicillin-binding protein [Candidatus Dependentiae bacterium]|nr:PBP1A family penicillin-binding protein [Candidatus Dependentiae bacterium]
MRQLFFIILVTSFLLFSFLIGFLCFIVHNHTIDFSSLQQDMQAKPSILLDVHGYQWGRFELEKRKYVTLEQMPEYLIQAFLVTEDRNFFKHPGISFRGIIRSIFVNVLYGRRMQGASTITQQLVRLKFLYSKKTLVRKIKEQFYAILVEREWSKEQILEAYLNNVYFGYGIYGVQAAAHRFWGIDIADISLEQAATLAGIMKSPLMYSPIYSPDNSFARRNLILKIMHDSNLISLDQMKNAQKKTLGIIENNNSSMAPHAKEMIRQILEIEFGKEQLYTGGLTIQTTLDFGIQQNAEVAFKEHVTDLKKKLHKNIDGGLLSVDIQTGAIRAMVGGYDFKKSKFNRAIQAHRQMGSIFKIFVYAAALEQGLNFWDVEIDEPFELALNGTIWAPKNYNDKFLGSMTRAYALSHSNNIVTIKTLLKTGIENIIDVAKRCHISKSMPAYPSLALGCVDVTPLEVVGSFNVLANHGMYVKPYLISWVKDVHGQKIYKNKPVVHQAISSKIASQIARVLSFGIQRLESLITDTKLDIQAFGKTGTNNDCRTCWFCGATPDLTTAIYIGSDSNESLGKYVFASRTAFPIWFNMHRNIAKNRTSFYYDTELKDIFVNWIDGTMHKNKNYPDTVPLLG